MSVFHRSERLLLRPVWPEDWRGILAGIAEQAIVRNLSRAPWPYREDDARAFANLPSEPLHPRFVMTRAADACVVGCIGIGPVDEESEEPSQALELGYWIAREHWSQGYATEAGRAVIAIAQTLGHRRLVASHFKDNPASGRVLQKLGFEQTGRLVQRYSCGRGEEAMTIEYARDLGAERGDALCKRRTLAPRRTPDPTSRAAA